MLLYIHLKTNNACIMIIYCSKIVLAMAENNIQYNRYIIYLNRWIISTFQEKFKREFRIKLRRFQRGHYGKPNANHGRSPSVRSTTLSEWKRGYSTRTKKTNLNGVTENSPRRDELEMYVYKSGKITLMKCGSQSDLEELCL